MKVKVVFKHPVFQCIKIRELITLWFWPGLVFSVTYYITWNYLLQTRLLSTLTNCFNLLSRQHRAECSLIIKQKFGTNLTNLHWKEMFIIFWFWRENPIEMWTWSSSSQTQDNFCVLTTPVLYISFIYQSSDLVFELYWPCGLSPLLDQIHSSRH